MKKIHASIKFCAMALLCVLSIPVIEYTGGYRCFPLVFIILPAQVVPYGIWIFAVVKLICLMIKSIMNMRQVFTLLGVLLIVLASMWLYRTRSQTASAYLWGLKTRFENNVGYTKMREYAREYAEEASKQQETIVRDPNFREDLSARYPFLGWIQGTGHSYMREDIVEHTWGSPLSGHWGFQVSPNGSVRDIERCRVLRISSDIQFVYYYD